MKKMMILAMMMVMTVSASAMRYGDAKREAMFLSEKMAYELALSDTQFAAVYNINLDYLMGLDSRNVFGNSWTRRNMSLRRVLSAWQYEKYMRANYFYRPASWHKGAWTFSIYNRYGRYNVHKAAHIDHKVHKHDRHVARHDRRIARRY